MMKNVTPPPFIFEHELVTCDQQQMFRILGPKLNFVPIHSVLQNLNGEESSQSIGIYLTSVLKEQIKIIHSFIFL